MTLLNKWGRGFNFINGIGLALIAICIVFIHFNSKPAQTQLTYLPFLLPLFFLLPLKKEIYSTEIKFLILVSFIFLSSLISYGIQGDIFTQDFRSHWTYLIAFGVFSVLIHKKITAEYLYAILILALILVFYDVLIEFFNHGKRGWNTHGKPIFFGNIALTTGLMAMILSLNKGTHWAIRILLILSSFAGIAGSIWSQTRGGWIYLIIFSIVFLSGYVLFSNNKKKAFLYGAIFLILLSIVALPFSKAVESRLSYAYSNIENYFSGGNANTSVGLRLELWRVSVEQFINNPLIGSARSGFLAIKNEMISESDITRAVRAFEHAHSDFFWTLGTKGLLGVISLYGFYLFLLRFYYINSKRKDVRLYAFSGITLVTSYIVYGLSESFFSMKLGIGYFIIVNLLLIRLISIYDRENSEALVFGRSN
jgi:O-antigen ligase